MRDARACDYHRSGQRDDDEYAYFILMLVMQGQLQVLTSLVRDSFPHKKLSRDVQVCKFMIAHIEKC